MRMSSTLLVTCSKPLIVLILGEKKFHGGVNFILPFLEPFMLMNVTLPLELERDDAAPYEDGAFLGGSYEGWLLLLLLLLERDCLPYGPALPGGVLDI